MSFGLHEHLPLNAYEYMYSHYRRDKWSEVKWSEVKWSEVRREERIREAMEKYQKTVQWEICYWIAEGNMS